MLVTQAPTTQKHRARFFGQFRARSHACPAYENQVHGAHQCQDWSNVRIFNETFKRAKEDRSRVDMVDAYVYFPLSRAEDANADRRPLRDRHV